MTDHTDNPTDIISSLPFHMQNLIVKHLDRLDRTTLARVNSTWQTVAERNIWDEVYIDGCSYRMEEIAGKSVSICPWQERVKALRSCPKRQGFVRSLIVIRTVARNYAHIRDMLVLCRASIVDINSFGSEVSSHVASAIHDVGLLPRLEKLRLQVGPGWIQTLNALENTPALINLSLEYDAFNYSGCMPDIPEDLALPRLASLYLAFQHDDHQILELAAACPRLEDLTLNDYGTGWHVSPYSIYRKIPEGQKLRKLAILHSEWSDWITSNELAVRFAEDFPQLESLQLGVSYDYLHDFRHPTIKALYLGESESSLGNHRYYLGLESTSSSTERLAPWFTTTLELSPHLALIDVSADYVPGTSCLLFCSSFSDRGDTLWVVTYEHRHGVWPLRAPNLSPGRHTDESTFWLMDDAEVVDADESSYTVLTSFRGEAVPGDIFNMISPTMKDWSLDCPEGARDLPLSDEIWEKLRTWHDALSEEGTVDSKGR